jgi:hypothetical protein
VEVQGDNLVFPAPGRATISAPEIGWHITIMLKQSHTSMKSPIICPGNSRTKSAIIQAKFGIRQEFLGYQ